MHPFRRLACAAALVVATVTISAACDPRALFVFRAKANALRAVEHVLSPAQLARLRACESGGNYRAVSSSGRFRGAYQFDQATWNGVAARHLPWLVGIDPIRVSTNEQDAMARALWSERGPAPWPVCGYRV